MTIGLNILGTSGMRSVNGPSSLCILCSGCKELFLRVNLHSNHQLIQWNIEVRDGSGEIDESASAEWAQVFAHDVQEGCNESPVRVGFFKSANYT